MKKLIAFLLALTLVLSLGGMAFAEDDGENSENQSATITQSQTISTKVPADSLSWTLIIPASFEVPYLTASTSMPGKCEITDVEGTIPEKQFIGAKLSYKGKMTKEGSEDYIPYELSAKWEGGEGGTHTITKTESQWMAVKINGSNGLTGHYTDEYSLKITDGSDKETEELWSVSPGTYSEEVTYTSALFPTN